MPPAGNVGRGKIKLLNIISVAFLVISLAAITYSTKNQAQVFFSQAKKGLTNAEQKAKERAQNFQNYVDSKIRKAERESDRGTGPTCDGAWCLAQDIINNQDNPANQTGIAKEIIDTYNAAVNNNDQAALDKLKNNSEALFNQAQVEIAKKQAAAQQNETTPTVQDAEQQNLVETANNLINKLNSNISLSERQSLTEELRLLKNQGVVSQDTYDKASELLQNQVRANQRENEQLDRIVSIDSYYSQAVNGNENALNLLRQLDETKYKQAIEERERLADTPPVVPESTQPQQAPTQQVATTSLKENGQICSGDGECGSGYCGVGGGGRGGARSICADNPGVIAIESGQNIPNYSSCQSDRYEVTAACNYERYQTQTGLNTITLGQFNPYVQSQQELNAQYGESITAQRIVNAQNFSSSARLGTTIVSEGAALVAAPGVITAGSLLGAGGVALNTLGGIGAMQQVSNAAIAQAENPGSAEAWRQTGLAVLYAGSLGASSWVPKLASAISGADDVVGATIKAHKIYIGLTGVNTAVASVQTYESCKDGISTACAISGLVTAGLSATGIVQYKGLQGYITSQIRSLPNYYETLGVSRGASATEIRTAYRNLATTLAPDKIAYRFQTDGNGNFIGPEFEAATKKFQDINNAYSVLGDAERRVAYNLAFFGKKIPVGAATNTTSSTATETSPSNTGLSLIRLPSQANVGAPTQLSPSSMLFAQTGSVSNTQLTGQILLANAQSRATQIVNQAASGPLGNLAFGNPIPTNLNTFGAHEVTVSTPLQNQLNRVEDVYDQLTASKNRLAGTSITEILNPSNVPAPVSDFLSTDVNAIAANEAASPLTNTTPNAPNILTGDQGLSQDLALTSPSRPQLPSSPIVQPVTPNQPIAISELVTTYIKDDVGWLPQLRTATQVIETPVVPAVEPNIQTPAGNIPARAITNEESVAISNWFKSEQFRASLQKGVTALTTRNDNGEYPISLFHLSPLLTFNQYQIIPSKDALPDPSRINDFIDQVTSALATNTPQTVVEIDGKSWYLFSGFKTGTTEKVVLGYIDNGSGNYQLRVFWKSLSGGDWRATRMLEHGHIDKGTDISYTQETQIDPRLEAYLIKHSELGERYSWATNPSVELLVNNLVLQNELGWYSYNPSKYTTSNIEANNVLSAINKYQAGELGKRYGHNSITGVDFYDLEIPDNFVPDFSKPPVFSFDDVSTHLGKVHYEVYEHTWNGLSLNWVMGHDLEGRIWIKNIYIKSSDLTSYGTYSEIFPAGVLVSKPLDYLGQTDAIDLGFTLGEFSIYQDITPLLDYLKPISNYRAVKGIQRTGSAILPIGASAPAEIPSDLTKAIVTSDGDPFVSTEKVYIKESSPALTRRITDIQNQVANLDARTIAKLINEAKYTDPLTGLDNRTAFVEGMNLQIASAAEHGTDLTVVSMDLKKFKNINDTLGHPTGDKALKAVAGLLKRNARSTDLVIRISGDEFVLILPQTGEAEARSLMQRILLDLENQKSLAGADDYIQLVNIDYGVRQWSQDDTVESFLKSLDASMYEQKRGTNLNLATAIQKVQQIVGLSIKNIGQIATIVSFPIVNLVASPQIILPTSNTLVITSLVFNLFNPYVPPNLSQIVLDNFINRPRVVQIAPNSERGFVSPEQLAPAAEVVPRVSNLDRLNTTPAYDLTVPSRDAYYTGDKMQNLYEWYRSQPEGWWMVQTGGKFNKGHFLAAMLVAEATGGDINLLKAIIEATKHQLWDPGNPYSPTIVGHDRYCYTSDCQGGGGLFNFAGAYLEVARRRYDAFVATTPSQNSVSGFLRDSGYADKFAEEGYTLERIANELLLNPQPIVWNRDVPSGWGNAQGWMYRAAGSENLGTVDDRGIYYASQGDFVYTEGQQLYWRNRFGHDPSSESPVTVPAPFEDIPTEQVPVLKNSPQDMSSYNESVEIDLTPINQPQYLSQSPTGSVFFTNNFKLLPRRNFLDEFIEPQGIVLHWDENPANPITEPEKLSVNATDRALRERKTSVHFAVGTDGVMQFLPMKADLISQAYGNSGLGPDINIEFSGMNFNELLPPQKEMDYAVDLIARLVVQYNIDLNKITHHKNQEDVNPEFVELIKSLVSERIAQMRAAPPSTTNPVKLPTDPSYFLGGILPASVSNAITGPVMAIYTGIPGIITQIQNLLQPGTIKYGLEWLQKLSSKLSFRISSGIVVGSMLFTAGFPVNIPLIVNSYLNTPAIISGVPDAGFVQTTYQEEPLNIPIEEKIGPANVQAPTSGINLPITSKPEAGLSVRAAVTDPCNVGRGCDGQRMYELYKFYEEQDAWWNQDGIFTPAEFTAIIVMGESLGSTGSENPNTLRETVFFITEAISNHLGSLDSSFTGDKYCTTLDCQGGAGVFNFLGAYSQSAWIRYDNLLEYNKFHSEKILNGLRDQQLADYFAANGITIEEIASKISVKVSKDPFNSPTDWGCRGCGDPGLNWIQTAIENGAQVGTTDFHGVYYIGEGKNGEVIYTRNQAAYWTRMCGPKCK